MRARSGQAMIEFALGMFVFALILSAILSLGAIIPECSRLMGEVRKIAGRNAQTGQGSVAGTLPPRILEGLPGPVREIPAIELSTEERDQTIDLGAFAAEYLFNANAGNEYRVRESVSIPIMGIPSFEVGSLTQPGGLL